ncbi:hypothetical protein GCM10022232_60430 [Streptomyces plumbiresistens]|uniref:Uncharacterized protein n=1 Tax=Streptomyces plumbiresistens TaxID=511811 RepID=A0ABP7SFP8_9ACTN
MFDGSVAYGAPKPVPGARPCSVLRASALGAGARGQGTGGQGTGGQGARGTLPGPCRERPHRLSASGKDRFPSSGGDRLPSPGETGSPHPTETVGGNHGIRFPHRC